MKTLITWIVFILLMGVQVHAQTASEKAEKADKNCVKEKMDKRDALEKAGGRVSSNIEKVQRGSAERKCAMEHLEAIEKNKEKQYIDKYNKEKPKLD